MRALAPVLVLGLSACVGGIGGGGPTVPDGPIVPILLDTGGIEAVGTGRRIDFGRHQPGVIQTMSRLQGGPPEALTCTDPQITAVTWDNALTLVFRENAFTGWGAVDPSLSFDGRVGYGDVCMGPA